MTKKTILITTLICLISGFYLFMQKLSKNEFAIFAQEIQKEWRGEIPPYFDLEDYAKLKFYWKASEGPLKLMVRPYKVGASGLMVQVSVWNLSNKARLVYPISPVTYVLSFRDETGKDITPKCYRMPPVLPRLIDISEFTRIEPGNCLVANYMLPNFYKYIKGFKKVECRVSIFRYYIVDKKKWRLSKYPFKLSSDWVEVPLTN